MATPSPRERVRARINTAIAPWQTSTEQPPFATTKLIIMALILSDQPLTQKEVWLWMMGHFSYYHNAAADALWNCGDYETQEKTRDLREELGAVYSLYEVPFVITNAGADTRGDVCYTITPLMGEAFLDLPDIDAASDESTFPFFELPAELRDTIYTMVFQYPGSGIGLGWRRDPYVLARDLDDRSPFDHMRAPPIFNEAMPIFFDINTFHFDCQASMSRRMKALSISRRKHMRSVGFRYQSNGEGDGHNFEALALLPKLKRLTLFFDEWAYRGWDGATLMRVWKDSRVMTILCRVKGLEEVKCVNLPALQELLTREMCQPKSALQELLTRKMCQQ
ncbi:hypothetical protein LTR15_012347 [Elasticomyces elasticus]|nr:hypothetical protein LTR15_012347 [Elasticomyces elasticus]